MDIRSDRQKGLSYVELGKKYHMDPRTAKRYAESPSRPEYTLTGPKPTKLDPYKQKIDQMLEEPIFLFFVSPAIWASHPLWMALPPFFDCFFTLLFRFTI